MEANLVADRLLLAAPTRHKQDLVQTVLAPNGILVRTKMTRTLALAKQAKAVRMVVHLMTVNVQAFVHLVSLHLHVMYPAQQYQTLLMAADVVPAGDGRLLAVAKNAVFVTAAIKIIPYLVDKTII